MPARGNLSPNGGRELLAPSSEASASLPASASTSKAPGRPHSIKGQVDVQATGPLPSEINELKGQVIQLSRTQAGSKYLQRQLLKGHPVIVNIILEEIEEDIVHLMCDAYGNYLCSQAFQACSTQQRKRLLEKLSPRVAATACDKRGTHALQALIGLLTTMEEQEILMRSIKNHVIELCMDTNGTHVVQRLLFCFMPPLNDFIYIPVIEHMVEVAHHPYGLCVLKKCISQAKMPGRHQDFLLQKLAENALDLVQSPYGNYAIQHALEEWGGDTCAIVLLSLEGRMMQLSIQKFSSNVVEKIFCVAPAELRRRFIDELIHSDKMSVLVSSNYGHYVVKRALQLADPVQVRNLLDTINSNLAQLPNRRLRAKWEKVMSVGTERVGDNRQGTLDLTSMLEPSKVGHHGDAASRPLPLGKGSSPHALSPNSFALLRPAELEALAKGKGKSCHHSAPLPSTWPAVSGLGSAHPALLQQPAWG